MGLFDSAPDARKDSASLEKPSTGLFDSAPPLTRAEPSFLGAAERGFKRTLPETTSTLVGSGALLAHYAGADDTRDALLSAHQKIEKQQVEPLAPSTGFIDAVTGDGSLKEWAGDTLGNFAGQALQSVAAAGAGALIGSIVPGVGNAASAVGGLVARGAVKEAVERGVKELVKQQIEKGVAREAAEAAGDAARRKALQRLGGGVAAQAALNIGQETGIAFTDRAEDAQKEGVPLTNEDATRALGYGTAAGLLDTAAEAFTAGRVRKGVSEAPGMLRRVATGTAQGMAMEGGTEGAQAVLERAGAAREVTGTEAYRDYVENIAAGALGGGVMGGASGVRRPDIAAPPPGQLTRAASTITGTPPVSAPATAGQTEPAQAPQAGLQAVQPPLVADTAAQAAPQPQIPDAAAQVLSTAAKAGKTIGAKALAKALGVEEGAAKDMLRDFEARGLVSAPSKKGARRVLVDPATGVLVDAEAAKADQRVAKQQANAGPPAAAIAAAETAQAGQPMFGPEAEARARSKRAEALARLAQRPDPAAGQTSSAGAIAFDTGAADAAAQEAAQQDQQQAVAAQKQAESEQQRAIQQQEREALRLQKQAQQRQSMALQQQKMDAQTYDEEDVRSVIESMLDQGQRIDALRLGKQMGVRPRVVDNIRRAVFQERSQRRANIRRAVFQERSQRRAPQAAGQDVIDAEFTDVTQADNARALPAPDRRPGQMQAVERADAQARALQAGMPANRTEAIAPQQPAPALDNTPEVLDDDITLPSGEPFTIRGAADLAAKRNPGARVVQVDGGFVARLPREATGKVSSQVATATVQESGTVQPTDGSSAVPAPSPATVKESLTVAAKKPKEAIATDVAGEQLDDKWTAFAPETGTLNVPRADMPQVKSVHRGAMVNFLGARGVTSEAAAEVDAASLKPTQAEFSRAKVKKAIKRAAEGEDRAILVSADGYVLDGHHQWLAKREAGAPVRVIRLNAPIADLLPLVKEFPSSTTAAGATAAEPERTIQDFRTVAPEPANAQQEAPRPEQAPAAGQAAEAEALLSGTETPKSETKAPKDETKPINGGTFSRRLMPRHDAILAVAERAKVTKKRAQEIVAGIKSEAKNLDGVAYNLKPNAVQTADVVAAIERELAAKVTLESAPAEAPAKVTSTATHKDPGQPAEPVTAAVIAEAAKTADAAPRVTMAEARKALLAMIDEAIAKAPGEAAVGTMDNPRTSAPRTESGWKVRDVSIDRKLDNGLSVPTLKIRQRDAESNFVIEQRNGAPLGRADSLLGARLLAGRLLMGAEWKANGGPAGAWSFKEAAVPGAYVTFDVPGDGAFKVLNSKERLQSFRKQVEQNFTDRKRDSFGFKPLPATRMSDAERARVLAEAEAETAAEDAKPTPPPAPPSQSVAATPEDAAPKEQPVAATGPADAKGERKFYVTMIRDSKVARIAGPFDTKAEADEILPAARDKAKEVDPRAVFDAFGVSAVTTEDHRPGMLNEQLGIGKPAPATIPEGYKPAGEPFYRDGKQVQGYAQFALGERVKIASGAQGVVTEFIGASRDAVPLFDRMMVKFDNGTETGVNARELQAVAPSAASPGKIEDFGEKLPPPRRALAARLNEDLTDDQISNRPLSEIWPLAENEAIEDSLAAAVAHAARAEIPAKPRQPFKLKRWVEKVKAVRELAAKVLDGRLTRERMQQEVDGPRPGLKDWWAKVRLLEQLPRDQWKRIGAVEERPDGLVWVAESKAWVKRPQLRIVVDDKPHYLEGDAPSEAKSAQLNDGAGVFGTIAGNMDGIRALLDGEAQDKGMQFEIRGSGARFFINKKGDPEYRHLMDFTSVEDARKALAEQRDSLVAAWQAVKDRDNITERDLRSAENRPRAGKNHRNGRDVTPQDFMQQFGFRGGEFGKWVQQGKGDRDRQTFLNSAYDALMDLADLVGIPSRAISLNGTLGLAFGSRGNGWASAHFEPSNLVINLTKTRGAGTLAHEWFHALDNYFSRLRRDGKEVPFTGKKAKYDADNFITHQPEALMVRKDGSPRFPPMTSGQLRARWQATRHLHDNYNPDKWQRDPANTADVRPEVEERFVALVEALNKSPMAKRAAMLDKGGRGYWSSTLERAARAFENHILARMHELGYHNDFLANVIPAESMGMNPERYPYLLPGEVAPIADAFDALFNTVQTKEGADGKVALFAKSGEAAPSLSWEAGEVLAGWRELAAKPDSFIYPTSDKQALEDIAAEVYPKLQVVHEVDELYTLTLPEQWVVMRDEKVARVFDTEAAAKAHAAEKGGEVVYQEPTQGALVQHEANDNHWFLSVSDWKPGQDGARVYAVVLNWAHANGKVLVPDPDGLTPINEYRRTEQMVSSALRYGTTRHMRPDVTQRIDGWVDEPANQAQEDGNLLALLQRSYENGIEALPELWEVDYDPTDTSTPAGDDMKGWTYGRFRDRATGADRTAEIVRLVGSDAARERGIGRTTLARIAHTHSLVRGDRRARGDGVLGADVPARPAAVWSVVRRLLYGKSRAGARGMTVPSLQGLFQKAIKAMADRGITVHVVTGEDLEAREPGIAAQPDYDRTVQAVISADRRTVYFVADRIPNAEHAQRLWAHEMVGHFSMEDMLGPRMFRELREAIMRLKDAGKWPEVFAEVSRRYERNADGTYRPLDDATFAAETIAVFAERNIQTSILQRALNAVRAWLRSMGMDLKLSQGELRQLLWEAGQKLEGRAYRSSAESILSKPAPKTQQEGMERYSFGKDDAGSVGGMRRTIPENFRQMPEFQDDDTSTVFFHGGSEGYLESVADRSSSSSAQWPGLFASTKYGAAKSHGPDVTAFRIDNSSVLEDFDGIDDERVTDALLGLLGRGLRETVASDPAAMRVLWRAVVEDRSDKVLDDWADLTGDDPGEASWYAQSLRGQLAAALGFKAVAMDDEHGRSWYIAPGVKSIQIQDSRQAPPSEGLGASGALFAKGSEPQAVDRLQAMLDPTSLWQSIKDKATDLQQVGLGALQLRHLGEIAEKFLPPVARYVDLVQRMQTTRNILQQASVDIVEKSMAYQKARKDEAPKMFRMLHDATLAGVDPSKEHQPLLMRSIDSKTNEPITLKAKGAFVKKMQELARLSPGDANAFMERAKQVKKMWAQEKKRAASHAEMAAEFAKLSPEARALWGEIRDTYAKQSAMYEQALKDRIESLAADGVQRAKMLTEMRLNFEANRVPFYVPLSRWGEYFVAATAPDGQREFHMQETAAEQRRVRADLVKAGYTKIASGVKTQMSKQLDGASADFVGKIDKLLKDSNAPDRVRDDVYQLYLQSLPEMSMRKNFIHRKGTRGYSEDAVRALASNVFHASYQIARLRYTHRMDAEVKAADTLATQLADAESPDANLAGRIVRELRDRHEWVMNPQDSGIAQKLTTVGFLWYLAVSPAAAAINLLQTAIVSLPVMAARYGWAATSGELWRAFKQSARTLGHMERLDLTPDERRAHDEFTKRGTFDKSQVHNLAGLSETDTASYDPRVHKALSLSSALFHGAEVINRESTSMAAYRLARAAGKSHEAAIEAADGYTNQTHLDYSNSNRSRYMRGAAAKVLLQFKQYSMGMTWLLGRTAWQATKAMDPQERAENRRALAGVLGMSAMFSGAMGLPMMGLVGGIMNAIAAAFGDDDEPWEFDAEFRAFLREHLGEKGAEYVLRGPVQALTGAGIAARTGMSELWLRSPDNELEGRALAQYYLEQAAGPVVGGMFVNALRGYQLMQEGHVWRGFETILPKFVKDGMKSVRYIDEGVNTLRGDAVIDDLSVYETIMQVMGISPARIGNTYDVQNDVTAYASHIENRRRYLMDAYALALRMGDRDAQEDVLAKMRAFSSKYPEKAITADSIRRSILQRQRYSSQAVSGVVVDPELRQRVERELAMN